MPNNEPAHGADLASRVRDLALYLEFRDGSKAIFDDDAGWTPYNPDPESELFRSGKYFTDSMAARWCKARPVSDLVAVGICTR